jgi:superfamily II RNA helicase
MVKLCTNSYPTENQIKYSTYFEKYPYSLSSFQKHSIEAIVEGHHVLVTAHTGSGKTLSAEFAIEYFVSQGKKVIYTSPIKALSNQKFYEFTRKFPHISFGILTGDIKTNPEADVLIMTTEILLNTLHTKNSLKIEPTLTTSTTSTTLTTSVYSNTFEMDFNNELACVVFDEIHYINDADRGKVWEETIMLLPQHIQMVMLSATLDSPEKFALWCETRGSNSTQETNKIVYLASTNERVVPLIHYSFITCSQGIFKILKDKQLEMEIMKTTNTLHIIQDTKGNFNDLNYQKITKTLNTFKDKNHYVKRQHVLNTVVTTLVDNNMLPAICFVLSRKALEQCAREVTISLLEDDSKVPYIVRQECEQIIRKLPNYQEYLNLPEYLFLVSLLEKGVAIHHAGIMPILREMVELLFAKGYIKLLFATETFAVGINMPTKTVLFTDMNKFNGSTMRPLYSHEYTQMAGRAGRRGIDTIGYVIHLTNLFKNIDTTTLKTIMKNKPQTLTSKFKISYNLILNLIDKGDTNYTRFVKNSMIQRDINNKLNGYYEQLMKIEVDIENATANILACKTPIDKVQEYIQLKDKHMNSINKKRKEIERNIQQLKATYGNIDKEVDIIKQYNGKVTELKDMNELITSTTNMLDTKISKVVRILHNDNFIYMENNINDTNMNVPSCRYLLTSKGKLSTFIRETHCLIFADLIETGILKKFEAKELVGILSCFTNISIKEEKQCQYPNTNNANVKACIENINEAYQSQFNVELTNFIETGIDYSIHFDLIDISMRWCECETDIDCKKLLCEISVEKDIFLGEFIKAILKINNITAEFERIAEYLGDMTFLSVLKQVPELTLKYVATNQSLYI